jgi:hypothetical protein
MQPKLRIEECVALAADARAMAKSTPDPRAKADLLQMAERWLRLATELKGHATLNGRPTLKRPPKGER